MSRLNKSGKELLASELRSTSADPNTLLPSLTDVQSTGFLPHWIAVSKLYTLFNTSVMYIMYIIYKRNFGSRLITWYISNSSIIFRVGESKN